MLVEQADGLNLGIGLDSFHILAAKTSLAELDLIETRKIVLAELRDVVWQQTPSVEEHMGTARHVRVFPGESVHSDELADLVRRLDAIGYTGDYSFEVFNHDYQQLPLPVVAERARKSAMAGRGSAAPLDAAAGSDDVEAAGA